MRRRLSTVVSIVAGLLLVALPAFATEGGEAAPAAEGQWTGLLLAAIVGIAVGVAVFFEAHADDDDASTTQDGH